MQNTLLTIAVALILALVAALVAPFVVDWNDYRSVVEREATRLTGIEVKVGGTIDARLLPSPQIVLHDVSVGGVPASALGVELSLGALMRGEWRATEVRIAAPRLEAALDRAGRLQWPVGAARFDPDALTIERLHVEDGSAVLTDAASGSRFVLDKIWFSGDARSLAGPVRGEGSASLDGEMYPYRLAAGRVTDDGTMRFKLNVEPVSRPLSIEADGDVSMAQGVPRFSGNASFSRPVQLAGNRAARAVTQPWRASAKVTATPASVLLEQVEFHYGSEDQGVTLTGTADVKFGAEPHIEGVLSARQLDLDRALAPADGTRLPAAAALRMLAEAAGGAPPLPLQLGIGIDTVTLGGGTVLAVRGDIAAGKDGWSLSGFEFRAPGSSRVQLAGRLAVQKDATPGAPAGVRFNGTASIDAADLQALVGWLDGRGAATPGPGRTLKARGDIAIGSDAIAVDRLRAQFGRETVEGRVSYVFASSSQPARLDAALRASELDIDGARAFVEAALAGSTLERPKDVALALDLGRATAGGVVLRDLRAKLTSSAAGLDIERLAVGDLGGAAVTVGGRIALSPAPRGNLTAELDARDLAGVATLLSRYAPTAAAPVLARLTGAATLRGTLAVDAATADSGTGKLSLDGSIGAVRVSLTGQASGDPTAWDKASLRLDGRLDSGEGPALVRLLALDGAVAVGGEPGRMNFSIDGLLGGDMRVNGQIAAGGLDATAAGSARVTDGMVTAALRTTVRRADLRPLLAAGASLPVSVSGDLAIGREQVALTNARGSVAGANLSGKLSVSRAPPWRLDGEVEADALNATALVTALAGAPAMPASGDGWNWPVEPFSRGVAAGYQGRIAFRSQRAALTSALPLRDLRGTLMLSEDGAAFEDVAGDLGSGQLTARLALRRNDRGLSAQGRVALAGVDAAAVLPAAARPPVTGRLGLDIDFEGAGLSPSALIGSLAGRGRLTLDAAQFASLDPRAFEALTRAADRGLAVDAIRVRDFMSRALDGGNLPVRHAEAGLQIASGQVRLQDVAVAAEGAALTVSGQLDLTQGTIDARLVLSGPTGETGGKPDLFMALRGPLSAPARTLDASALSGWLTLRAVEMQAKKLEAIEAAQPHQPAREPVPSAPTPPASEQQAAPSVTPLLAPPLPPPQMVPPAPAPKPQSRAQPVPHPPAPAPSSMPLQILPRH